MSTGHYENVDGHRVWTPTRTEDAPAPVHQRQEPGAPEVRTAPELLCDPAVTCGLHWTYDGGSVPVVAVFMPPQIAYALAALLPDPISRDALNGAAGAVALEQDCAEILEPRT